MDIADKLKHLPVYLKDKTGRHILLYCPMDNPNNPVSKAISYFKEEGMDITDTRLPVFEEARIITNRWVTRTAQVAGIVEMEVDGFNRSILISSPEAICIGSVGSKILLLSKISQFFTSSDLFNYDDLNGGILDYIPLIPKK